MNKRRRSCTPYMGEKELKFKLESILQGNNRHRQKAKVYNCESIYVHAFVIIVVSGVSCLNMLYILYLMSVTSTYSSMMAYTTHDGKVNYS